MNIKRVLLAMLTAGFASGAVQAADDDLDALFDLGGDGEAAQGAQLSGYAEFGGAYTWPRDGHWSKLRARVELGLSGRLGERSRYKLSARADVDGAQDMEGHHYPRAVQRNQRRDLSIREAYVDFGAGEWEFRLGRQHVVWGEMVGLFFADVVSARDLREFYLPEFEALRIPQWAARAEYFAGETHFELLWIPAPSYDEIGKPGADFYPYPLPAGMRVREERPSASLRNSNWGLRASRLIDGWDLSAFHYQSYDVSPTLYRLAPQAFELRHDRIRQSGLTLSKDLGSMVLKGEAVYTHGRSFATARPGASFGLTRSDTLDYVVGVDIPVRDVWRINLQYYARVFYDHERGMPNDRHESGVTLLVNRRFGDDFEAEILYVSSLNRSDYMLRPKLIWKITPEWRGQVGVDVFGGRRDGIFGRYDDSDRVYVELRRWF
ncbi:DUF1302 family protein [Pseudothauera lacus]|uniref:Uncharacterized protein n=1 Tax=Pseudothauera lacus TaxID=2136175 RepID=A0A2T4IG54_9RHOO|nr:DUF1302 family protein [Pseudothauera lacus]PTD96750.1 hypothetical protein C8261_08020 [Pseudothauera lacus]